MRLHERGLDTICCDNVIHRDEEVHFRLWCTILHARKSHRGDYFAVHRHARAEARRTSVGRAPEGNSGLSTDDKKDFASSW